MEPNWERRDLALELRLSGLTWKQVGEHMGISGEAARRNAYFAHHRKGIDPFPMYRGWRYERLYNTNKQVRSYR